jgi:hypothetical protein
MKLVEADAEGPQVAEDEAPRPTPPRPERRRVVVSLGFTVAVLLGTVVTIYAVFPARHNYLATAATDAHHETAAWQVAQPTVDELRAWFAGALGDEVPLPDAASDVAVVGVRRVELLNRLAAVVRYQIGGSDVTMVIQRARDPAARRVSRTEGDDHVESWRTGKWSIAAVGPAATAPAWGPRVGAPPR